jgi:hypothetical protein
MGPSPGIHFSLLGRDAGTSAEGAVVFTVTVAVALVAEAVKLTEAEGMNVHEAPVGSPEHPRATVPVKPLTAVTVTERFAELPADVIVTAGFEELR